ncbi:transposase, partial [Candidatus Saganbacteria bacterium]|nr:transposase [Candidatus Saganbacteria bacterium]
RALSIPDQPLNLYIPLVPTKNKTGGFLLDEFSWENGHLFCPGGYPAEYMRNDDNKMGFEFKFNAAICHTCERRPECTSAQYGRSVFVSHTQLERQNALSFNVTDEYQTMYNEQHWKVEPKNADLKRYCGLNRARYRGLGRVRIQACLSAMASNFKKIARWIMGKIKNGVYQILAKIAALAPPKGELRPNTG